MFSAASDCIIFANGFPVGVDTGNLVVSDDPDIRMSADQRQQLA